MNIFSYQKNFLIRFLVSLTKKKFIKKLKNKPLYPMIFKLSIFISIFIRLSLSLATSLFLSNSSLNLIFSKTRIGSSAYLAFKD